MGSIRRIGLGISAALLLGGCVVAPVPASGPYYGEPVVVAPPRVEYPGPPPAVGYVWIGGDWNWYQGRRVWSPGRWEAPHGRGPIRMAPPERHGEGRGPDWHGRDGYRGDDRRFDSSQGWRR